MTPAEVLPQLLGPLGLLVGCVCALWAFQREWVVPGASYRRQCRETDYWRRLALAGTSLAQKATNLAVEKAREETPM